MAFDVWHTFDLVSWEPYVIVTNVNTVDIGGSTAEFFKVRSLDPVNGLTSDWSSK